MNNVDRSDLSNKDKRKLAYMQEADALFFKWQRGDGTKEEWLAKVNEIKQKYPD